MTVLSANRLTPSKGEARITSHKVAASVHIYDGGLVVLNSAGYAAPARSSGAHFTNAKGIAGIAAEEKDNSTGSNGDLTVKVKSGHRVKLAGSSLTQAGEGGIVYVTDDQTVNQSSGLRVGRMAKYVSSTSAWVHVGPEFAA